MPRSSRSVTNLTGVQEALANLNNFAKGLDAYPIQEVTNALPIIKADMVAQTPYRTGTLEASITLKKFKRKDGWTVTAGAQALNPNTGYNYAIIQHENIAYNHPIKGNAYYIENPLLTGAALISLNVERRLRKLFKPTKPKAGGIIDIHF